MLRLNEDLSPAISRFVENDWKELFNWPANNSQITFVSAPPLNITETDDNYLVQLAAPGYKKSDFDVVIEDNKLVISVQETNMSSSTKNSMKVIHREFNYTGFTRTVRINTQIIDQSNIQGKYQNGILYLELPKIEEAKKKPAVQISIK